MPRHRQENLPVQPERGPLERLLRRSDAVGEGAEDEINKALREIRAEIALLVREKDVGGSAEAREEIIAAAQAEFAKLRKRLSRMTDAAAEYAAQAGFAAGMAQAPDASGVTVRYSKERADDICAIVTGGQGKNLAAVFTENMEAHVIDALRAATVSAMRENAVAGGTRRELARTLEEKWLGAAKDGETYQFVDAGGSVWDTKTYVAMNVRTNAMRVYNDSLVDTIARKTGSDLVRVSTGGDPDCRLCFPWEGRILSITGQTKGFPTYDEAREAGCFHPNCVHTLEAVDELFDKDEIELQRQHPIDAAEATPEELDDNRYEIDQERYRRKGMTAEQARLAVDRDNLEASIRAGLVREDSRELVNRLTDEQVRALCPNGNPPVFEPTKRATRADPHAADEGWNRGRRGGVVHISRHATLEKILEVCGVTKKPVKTAATATAATAATAAQAAQAEAEAAKAAAAAKEAEERKGLLETISSVIPPTHKAGLEHTFDKAPTEVLRTVAQTKVSVKCDLGTSKAHCEAKSTEVHLAKKAGTWGNNPSTLRHETGHAVFNAKGQYSMSPIQPEYLPIVTAARTETEAWAAATFGEKWRSECKRSSRNWYTWFGKNVFGFTDEELKDVTLRSIAGDLSDIMCCASRGRQFYGHPKRYITRSAATPLHEIVANATDILCSGYADKVRKIMPQTLAAVEKIVYGVGQASK